MRNLQMIVACLLMSQLSFAQQLAKKDYTEFVNPLMGTDSHRDFSNGNTYPAVGLPWGMHMWTPQTGNMGNGWQYTYEYDFPSKDTKINGYKIRGFKQTHQPSPWMNDYGQFSIMPVTGRARFLETERASWFSHKAETAKPYYYGVYLADADVKVEMTATERAAQFQLTYPKTDSSFLVIDAFDHGSYIKILPKEKKIIGYSTRATKAASASFKDYFVIYADKEFETSKVWDDSSLVEGALELKSNHAGALVGFKTRRGEVVHLKVASSFISFEQAELNLKRELAGDDFTTTCKKAKDKWNEMLGRVDVEGGTLDQQRTFYSCLYRTLFFPNKLYEIDANNQLVHFSPYNQKIEKGYLYGGTGFWDTFRALYPLLNLLYPSINKEMQEGLINDYKEGGWLPEWSSPGYSNTMIGNNSASVVAEAYLKGGRGYDINTLYEALLHGANNEGPIRAVGRAGAPYYNKLGYVPFDINIKESAACTLEYAYDDFAIYKLAKALGRPSAEIELYAQRCLNYMNLFDSSTKLMRGKDKSGRFEEDFNPFKWGGVFTEGNSWHYSWSVFHDIQGLIKLMGGEKQFVSMLDSVFVMPPVFDESYYRFVIHEIREMQVAGMGQYAHGNQPIQHMPYLYNYAGQPWKTQYWVRQVMDRMYKPTPDGYCGDEDNGQTSAWYVFSALGFYPVCPTTAEYVLGAPLFKKAVVRLENGKKLVINAPNNGANNFYVNQLNVNGTAYGKNYLSHEILQKGLELNFKMDRKPNEKRGANALAYPYSFSTDKERIH